MDSYNIGELITIFQNHMKNAQIDIAEILLGKFLVLEQPMVSKWMTHEKNVQDKLIGVLTQKTVIEDLTKNYKECIIKRYSANVIVNIVNDIQNALKDMATVEAANCKQKYEIQDQYYKNWKGKEKIAATVNATAKEKQEESEAIAAWQDKVAAFLVESLVCAVNCDNVCPENTNKKKKTDSNPAKSKTTKEPKPDDTDKTVSVPKELKVLQKKLQEECKKCKDSKKRFRTPEIMLLLMDNKDVMNILNEFPILSKNKDGSVEEKRLGDEFHAVCKKHKETYASDEEKAKREQNEDKHKLNTVVEWTKNTAGYGIHAERTMFLAICQNDEAGVTVRTLKTMSGTQYKNLLVLMDPAATKPFADLSQYVTK